MGTGYICKCPECGYILKAFLGVGMMYPITMKEEISKMKKGRYGEQGMRFFKEHPNGIITCKSVVMRCMTCGNLDVTYDFNLIYRRSKDTDEKPQMAIAEIDTSYEVEKYIHICKKCKSKAEIEDNFEAKLQNGEIACPKCKGTLYQSGIICWD